MKAENKKHNESGLSTRDFLKLFGVSSIALFLRWCGGGKLLEPTPEGKENTPKPELDLRADLVPSSVSVDEFIAESGVSLNIYADENSKHIIGEVSRDKLFTFALKTEGEVVNFAGMPPAEWVFDEQVKLTNEKLFIEGEDRNWIELEYSREEDGESGESVVWSDVRDGKNQGILSYSATLPITKFSFVPPDNALEGYKQKIDYFQDKDGVIQVNLPQQDDGVFAKVRESLVKREPVGVTELDFDKSHGGWEFPPGSDVKKSSKLEGRVRIGSSLDYVSVPIYFGICSDMVGSKMGSVEEVEIFQAGADSAALYFLRASYHRWKMDGNDGSEEDFLRLVKEKKAYVTSRVFNGLREYSSYEDKKIDVSEGVSVAVTSDTEMPLPIIGEEYRRESDFYIGRDPRGKPVLITRWGYVMDNYLDPETIETSKAYLQDLYDSGQISVVPDVMRYLMSNFFVAAVSGALFKYGIMDEPCAKSRDILEECGLVGTKEVEALDSYWGAQLYGVWFDLGQGGDGAAKINLVGY